MDFYMRSATGTRPEPDESADNLIVITSEHPLSRECFIKVLGTEFKAPVTCFATIEDWVATGPAPGASLVVLCQRGRERMQALHEVDRLVAAADRAGCASVVLSDNEDPDLI